MTTTDAAPALDKKLRQYRTALRRDADSKAAYINRVRQIEHVTIISEDGTSFEKEVSFPISWISISKILDLIEKRAEG